MMTMMEVAVMIIMIYIMKTYIVAFEMSLFKLFYDQNILSLHQIKSS